MVGEAKRLFQQSLVHDPSEANEARGKLRAIMAHATHGGGYYGKGEMGGGGQAP